MLNPALCDIIKEKAESRIRMNKEVKLMKLILLSGVAGVGKSTYIKDHLAGATVLSSDEIGAELGVTGGNILKYSKLCMIELAT